MRILNRQAIIEWRARAVVDPQERLRFLRKQMGSEWPEPVLRRGWIAPVLAACLTVVLISGVLMSAFEFRHLNSIPISRPVILAPPVMLSSEAPNDSQVWLVDRKDDYETYSNGLRIENRYSVSTQPRRRYRVFDRKTIDAEKALYLERPSGKIGRAHV